MKRDQIREIYSTVLHRVRRKADDIYVDNVIYCEIVFRT